MHFLRFIAILCLVIYATISSGRVVDDDYAIDDVLRRLTSQLDTLGVDVRNRMGGREIHSNRAQVADLRNFPAKESIAGTTSPFDENFGAGIASDRAFLVAVNAPGQDIHPSEQKFRQIWQSARPDERIFVSFSSQDIRVAEKLAVSLNAAGFVTFTYMNGSTELPLVNALETGQYFRQAGRHYVIDTPNARQSLAVNAEALALERNNRRPPPFSGRTSDGIPCCKRCIERYGIRTCGEVFCGEIACAGAR